LFAMWLWAEHSEENEVILRSTSQATTCLQC